MYSHPAFRIDRAEALAMMKSRGFGLLIVPDPDAPMAVHVPFLMDEGDHASLRIELHVARANPIHALIGDGRRVLFVCQGPDAYISPDWYGVDNQVPTWTYVAVHLTGTARVLEQGGNLAHSERLSAFFEERLRPKKPWTTDKMSEAKRDAMAKSIVAIEITVDTLEGVKKLIQHKGETEHRGAIAGLRARGDAGSLEISALMEETLSIKAAARS